MYAQKSPDYEHISEEDMKKVKKSVDEKRKWFDDACNKLSKVEKHQNAPISVSNINDEYRSLDSACHSIVTKPKPKVEPPAPPPAGKGEGTTAEGGNNSKTPNDAARNADGDAPMDVDNSNAADTEVD